VQDLPIDTAVNQSNTLMMTFTSSSSSYPVPMRDIVAIEHPMIIKNIDNGLKTLGTGVPPRQVSTLWIFDG
jgi:hypothetical protein